MRKRAFTQIHLTEGGPGNFRIFSGYFPKVDAVEPLTDVVPTGDLLIVRVTGSHKAMIVALSKRRFDEQLDAMLDDASEWKVTGTHGIVLSDATSLRVAVEKAMEVTARGHEVVALVHRARPEVIVFASQLQRLAHRIAEAQYCERGLRA